MGKEDEINIENIKAQMRKGVLEFPILLIIAQKEAYASDILAKLMGTDLIVVEGTLYPLLSRLKRTGLVEYSWKESKSGPPRKYYTVTLKGREVLNQLQASWESLDNSITKLIKEYEKGH